MKPRRCCASTARRCGVSAKTREKGAGSREYVARLARRRLLRFVLLVTPYSLLPTACSWFTDFKEQPKIDPWESPSDSVPPRGNPQGSVSIYGSSAPGFEFDRSPTPAAIQAMAGLKNPVPAESASISRGRVDYQINCAVCHGVLGAGDGVVNKYGG